MRLNFESAIVPKSLVLILLVFSSCSIGMYAANDSGIPSGYVSIDSFGLTVTKDGTTIDGTNIQAIINGNPNAKIYFPAGQYLLNNYGAAVHGLDFANFTGSFYLNPSAKFLCNTATAADAGQCLNIGNANGSVFTNLTVGYSDTSHLPLPRTSCSINNAILVINSNNITFNNLNILASPGSGVWITDSTNVSVSTSLVSNTSADGLHFENVLNGKVTDYTSNNTGDDGLAMTNIQPSNPNCGLTADQIHIHYSLARGIAIAGGCNASITNFTVDHSTLSGISTTQDTSISSRRSSQISFSGGTVSSSGLYCGEIAASDTVTYVTLSNSSVTNAGNVGAQVTDSSSYITVSGLTVNTTTNEGLAMQNVSHATYSNVSVTNSGSYGFYHSSSENVSETNMTFKNVAKTGGNHRAWWAENMTAPVNVATLYVIDDQTTATGYVVGDWYSSSTTNPTVVSNITFALTNGAYSLSPYGSTDTFTLH